MTTFRVNLKCSSCGGETFAHPENPQPDDDVTCAGCGQAFKWSDFQAAAKRLDSTVPQFIIDAFKLKK